jgi:hypothetical protein
VKRETTPLKELGSYRRARRERRGFPFELRGLCGLRGENRAFFSRVVKRKPCNPAENAGRGTECAGRSSDVKRNGESVYVKTW